MVAVADADIYASIRDPGKPKDISALHVTFEVRDVVRSVVDAEKTKNPEEPVLKEALVEEEYIEIRVPGDETNIVCRPVTQWDKQRFRYAYEAWKDGRAGVANGTPLADWPALRPYQVADLARHNIHTVEQFAALSDGNAARVGPVMALRERARAFIAAKTQSAPLEALQAENRALAERLAAMEARLSAPKAEATGKGK